MRRADLPGLAVSGDVGMLALENAQRLVSIFCEAAMSCLGSLREVAERRGGSEASRLQAYARGLGCIRQWSVEVLHEEVAAMEAQYPEASALHRFVTVAAISELADTLVSVPGVIVPPLAETYHAFLKRVVASSDVTRLAAFLEAPMAHRRVVFLDAFRNAYHDTARRSASRRAQPLHPSTLEAAAATTRPCDDDKKSVASAPPPSRLQQAVASLGGKASSAKDVVLLDTQPTFFDADAAAAEKAAAQPEGKEQ
jgi:hypothetical protein